MSYNSYYPLGKPTVFLDAVEADGSSTGHNFTKDKASFQVIGTGTWTVTIEVSNDETNWQSSGLTFTAAGVGAIDVAFVKVRATVSGYADGDVSVIGLI